MILNFRLNVFLGHLNLGERTIKGCLEAYSCKHLVCVLDQLFFWATTRKISSSFFFFFAIGKHAGSDKRLSLSLENEVI